MKVLIVYDSFFGNTQKVAEGIAKFLSEKHKTVVKNVDKIKKEDFEDIGLLIVGSPTRAFNSSEKIQKFLGEVFLKNLNFIVFDTRTSLEDIPMFFRPIFVLFGYADRRMVKALKRNSAIERLPSQGFFVKGKEGPLKKGELEKIGNWLKNI